MKIAVNTRFLLPGQLEGFGWYTHEIVRRMVLQHPEDQFFFFFDRPFDPRFVYAENVTPMVLFPPARHPILFRWWFEWSVCAALKKVQASVFFSPDSMCSLSSSAPTVMTCHDLVPLHFPEQVGSRHRSFLLKFLPKWLHRANHVLTVSNFVRQDIMDTCKLSPARITTVYNACRDGFKPLDEPEKQVVRENFSSGAPYFFYAGAIHPRKNVHRLIRAFDRFKQAHPSPVKLLLAGRFAWQTGDVRSAWDQAVCKDDIVFLGYVEEAQLPLLTAAAQASLYMSISEGFGLPLVEAMACDTPVMTSNTSCLPEIAGDAALLADPLDEAAMAVGMARLWSDSTLRDQLIRAGRRRIQMFSWDKAAEEIYSILKATAGDPTTKSLQTV